MFKMSTTGRDACVQTFAQVIRLIALLIVVCGKSSQICCSALFSSGMVFGFE